MYYCVERSVYLVKRSAMTKNQKLPIYQTLTPINID